MHDSKERRTLRKPLLRGLTLLLALLMLAGCGGGKTAETETEAPKDSVSAAPETEAPPETEPDAESEPAPETEETPETEALPESEPWGEPIPEEPYEGGTLTLMVYMVGSDLESKSGAATADLEEIAASGVDLKVCTVLVCAGGTPHWHNELEAENNSILRLTADGFETERTSDSASMGEAACLTDFLNYAYENAPADRYALILWDHGNGPVVGYGKDVLYGNDALTLQEMRDALEASPFGEGNRLAWVGFDACLMASAELACIWSDYADYLMASQEIEPAFGWDYSFLSELGRTDTETLLGKIAARYMETCESYYAERGFEGRDTTLSCVDLSQAEALRESVDALFAAASGDMPDQFDEFASSRAETRSFGRSTTGSEYDLIDLGNLASRFRSEYPEEAEAVLAALEKAVVVNENNAADCCGLSLYYPFYNKRYYEQSWAETYAALDLLPHYSEYLKQYDSIWLRADEVEDYATSTVPEQTAEFEFTYRLTEEQARRAARAGYRVLQKMGEDKYNVLFCSGDISYEDGVITSNFDGNVIYVKNSFGESVMLPTLIETDRVGGQGKYLFNALGYRPAADGSTETEQLMFSLTANEKTKRVSLSAVTVKEADDGEVALRSGKAPDVDLADYSRFLVPYGSLRYLTRNSEGTVLGLEDWDSEDGVLILKPFYTGEGVEFVYAPLDQGEYVMIFEICDTQGNAYCSEPLPFEIQGGPQDSGPEEVPALEWNEGDRFVLTETAGVTVSLLRLVDEDGKVRYTPEVVNGRSEAVRVSVTPTLLNGEIDPTRYSSVTLKAEAGQTAAGSLEEKQYFKWDEAIKTGLLKRLERMELKVEIQKADYSRAAPDAVIAVKLSEAVGAEMDKTYTDGGYRGRYVDYEDVRYPYLGARAEEQILFEDDLLRITLKALGSIYRDDRDREENTYRDAEECLSCYLVAENKTDEPVFLDSACLVINGVVCPWYGFNDPHTPIPPHAKLSCEVDGLSINDDEFGRAEVRKVSSVVFEIGTGTDPYGDLSHNWAAVTLAESAPETPLPEIGGEVLFEENGLRITLESYREETGEWSSTVTQRWMLVLENEGTEDYCVQAEPVGDSDVYLDQSVGVGQRNYTYVTKDPLGDRTDIHVDSLRFRFVVYEYSQARELFRSGEIELKAGE